MISLGCVQNELQTSQAEHLVLKMELAPVTLSGLTL